MIDSVVQGNAWQQITPSGSAPTAGSAAGAWSEAADGLYIFGGDLGGGNDLWLFSRQAGSEVENAHRRQFVEHVQDILSVLTVNAGARA